MTENTSTEKKYAIPVGTGSLIEMSKFLFEERYSGCVNKCRSGYKSIAPKNVNGTIYQVPIICTCVPYVASQDKDGNYVVVYRGNRELWPGKKRPEQYIQNDMQRSAEFERAKDTLASARSQSKAHDGVSAGKYTLGVLSPSEQRELGAELVKSLKPRFETPGEAQEHSDLKSLVQNQATRRVAMRNKEGNIIMVDDATANNMKRKGIAVPERPAAPEAKTAPASTQTQAPASAPKKRGRPPGAKNKPKASKE